MTLTRTPVRLLALLAILGGPLPATAGWVRDGIYINMRTGPTSEYRIIKNLASGVELELVNQQENWIEVRDPEGDVGWIRARYWADDAPASVLLPKKESDLADARARINLLEQQIESQGETVAEVEALRERLTELQRENNALSDTSQWKLFAAGGGVILIGMGLGAALSRSGTPQRRIRL